VVSAGRTELLPVEDRNVAEPFSTGAIGFGHTVTRDGEVRERERRGCIQDRDLQCCRSLEVLVQVELPIFRSERWLISQAEVVRCQSIGNGGDALAAAEAGGLIGQASISSRADLASTWTSLGD